MSRRRKFVVLILAAAFVAFTVTVFIVISHMVRTDPSKARLVHAKMPVTLSPVKLQTINYVIGASGQTQELETAILTARIAQPVTSVKVKIGDRVHRGQVLLEFEQKLMNAFVNQAKNHLAEAATNLDYSRLNYQRLSNLYKQNLIAKVDIEKADELVKSAEHEYATAQHQLEKARQDMNFTVVRSSVTGIILERTVNPGETPRMDAHLVTLGIIDDVFMMAKVAEDKISYISLKQEAEVLFDSFPNITFKGEIVKIDPNTDPKTRTFIAYLRILNKDLKLMPGLTGFSRIFFNKKALVVPSISVLNPVGEHATVFLVDSDSIVHLKKVKIGISSGGVTEILEGLNEGDNVAFAGIQALKDGDKINVMEKEL
jgi:RND family efflux transporter MFP subunit